MAKKDEAPAAEGTEAAPKKGKKKLIMILAIVLLAGAGAAAYFMMKPKSAEDTAAAEAAAEAAKKGVVYPLEALTVNLADGHYLKFSIALQATKEATEEEMEGSKALDIAIEQYTDMKVGELSSTEGREKVKKELTEKVAEAYEDLVMDIYFTSFVMQ